MKRHPGLIAALLGLLGVLALGSFPVRAYLDQQAQRQDLRARVKALTADNKRLADQAAQLDSNDVIEQLARQRYQLVKPGEEAYSILPDAQPQPAAAAPSPTLATTPPPAGARGSWWGRAWDRITTAL